MEKHVIRGAKKIFSLTRTKIRLAEEAQTIDTKPIPLPLVKMLSGKEINNVNRAKEYREELLRHTDFSDPGALARAVLQLMDIIEGVKYKFEPPEYCLNLSADEFMKIEAMARKNSMRVNLLLMTKDAPDRGVNLFIGENSPGNSIFLSRVPTSIAGVLNLAFKSDYLSDGLKLRNVTSVMGHRTLILNAIHFSLGWLGAELRQG